MGRKEDRFLRAWGKNSVGRKHPDIKPADKVNKNKNNVPLTALGVNSKINKSIIHIMISAGILRRINRGI